MTDEQIQQLVNHTKRNQGRAELWLAVASWFATGIFTLWGWQIHFEAMAMFSLAVGGAISFLLTGNYLILREEQLRSPAFAIWSALTERKGVPLSQSLQTRKFHQSISELYQEDTGAKSLSFVQCARLLVIHELQQKRREVIWRRLVELRSWHDEISESTAKLEPLSDLSPPFPVEIEEINRQVAELEMLHGELNASCYRLESIVLAAQRSLQAKQLHPEVVAFKSSAIFEERDDKFDFPAYTDIEQQIDREVEISRQLERETNTYL